MEGGALALPPLCMPWAVSLVVAAAVALSLCQRFIQIKPILLLRAPLLARRSSVRRRLPILLAIAAAAALLLPFAATATFLLAAALPRQLLGITVTRCLQLGIKVGSSALVALVARPFKVAAAGGEAAVPGARRRVTAQPSAEPL